MLLEEFQKTKTKTKQKHDEAQRGTEVQSQCTCNSEVIILTLNADNVFFLKTQYSSTYIPINKIR